MTARSSMVPVALRELQCRQKSWEFSRVSGAALAAGPDVVDFEHVEGVVFVAAVEVAFLLAVKGVLDLASGEFGAVGAFWGGGVDGEDAVAEVQVSLGHAVFDEFEGFRGSADAGEDLDVVRGPDGAVGEVWGRHVDSLDNLGGGW